MEPLCEAAANHMEPFPSIVSYHLIDENGEQTGGCFLAMLVIQSILMT